MATEYPYDILKVATDRLAVEISAAITVSIDHIDVGSGTCSVWFATELSEDELALLSNIVAAHSGFPLPSPPPVLDIDHRLVVAPVPRIGNELIMATHNFCDPTTWYSTSARVTNQTMSDTGDGLIWLSDDPHWIDMTHGKMFDEDSLAADQPHSYAVTVTVDSVPMSQRAPFATSGGDYTVNYSTGSITFASSQTGKTVLASYSKAVDSTWVLTPDPGTFIDVESAKVQFSADIELTTGTAFDIYVYNPYDLPNKVLYKTTLYKTLENYIEEAIDNEVPVPALGGSTRGTSVPIHSFKFKYATIRRLDSAQGIELRIRTQGDIPFQGYKASATFYCTVGAQT